MVNIPRIVKNLVKKYETRNPFKRRLYLGIIVLYKDLGETKGPPPYTPAGLRW